MAEIKKEGLLSGSYKIDKNGKVETFNCNQDDLAYFQKRINDMVEKGNHIPITWEHQSKVEKPLSQEEFQNHLAEKTKNTLGHVKGANLSGDRAVEMILDVPNDDDAKKLPSVKFVSPTIMNNITDPMGNYWAGPSITALAITSQPIQVDQKPFERIALSINGYNGVLSEPAIRLSEAMSPVANSGNNFVQLLQVLASPSIGLVLPPDTTPGNFMDRLYTSALTKATMVASGGKAHEVTMPVSNGGGVMMSQNAQPDETNLKIEKVEKTQLLMRIDDLYNTKRITPFMQKELKGKLEEIRLSVNATGEVEPSEIHVRLKVLEQLPENIIQLGKSANAAEFDEGGFSDRPTRVQNLIRETVSRLNGKKKKF